MFVVIQDVKNWDNLDKVQPERLPMEAVAERWTKKPIKYANCEG